MVFVDTHCHLDWKDYGDEIDKIIFEMKDKGIIAWTMSLNPKSYIEINKKFKSYDSVKICAGLYPQDSEKISDMELKEYCDLIRVEASNIIAIGEVGLDFKDTKNVDLQQIQIKRFRQMIEIAIELDKPISIHARKAEREVIGIIREYVEKTGFKKFILHCFCGKKKFIKEIIELNIYCSIPFIIRNTESFQLLVKELPIKQILVETDSPFLHPDKVRNSPLSVPAIYHEIARIKGFDLKEIENIIYRNIMKILL